MATAGRAAHRASSAVSKSFTFPFGSTTASATIDWTSTIRSRFGMLVQPRFLMYATAGLGIVHSDAKVIANVMGFQSSVSESVTATGFVYGLGVESNINDAMSLRVEYLGFSEANTVGDFGIVRAGLNFKFSP